MPTEQAIVVENVSKSYGDFLAVKEVSFTVNYGEIFAMIGPNGAGKSTTIRMILDILKPDSGRIAVFGGTINEVKKNRIGYLPEERGLYKNVSITQMLTYLGQLKGMSRSAAKSRAETLLKQLDLGDHLKSKVTALSKGMAQKVQFIATIMHDPELIIVDEAFSGLDPVNTQVIQDLMYRMRDEGKAVVMSTHQMHQVEEMAQRVLMISHGQRVLYGDVDEVRQQYAENAVVVSGEGDWASLPGVERVDVSKNNGTLLHLNANTTPDDVMQALAVGNYRVKRFELAVPSLQEIFIRVAGEPLPQNGEIKQRELA